mmetsp:Transcript_46839/g.114231  ORF Transcript_46839/g.114231 Transcript_46839/m.114231 type:complete len:93 (+) Transcript_46839:888-1166(+)
MSFRTEAAPPTERNLDFLVYRRFSSAKVIDITLSTDCFYFRSDIPSQIGLHQLSLFVLAIDRQSRQQLVDNIMVDVHSQQYMFLIIRDVHVR